MGDVKLNISDFKHISLEDIKVEDAHYEWQSCCCAKTTDSRLLKFASVYLMLFMTFIFCLTMLFYADSCETETTYIALLTFILGLVIPSHK
jgi:RsiW-degrading membrane proteinase PrsW (M82 family)